MEGKLFILTGPSGVGKTTVAERLRAAIPNLKRLVTCTTRAPRPGEVDGQHYHFVTREVFEAMIANNELFEWDEHYGQWYGNRIADVEALLAHGGAALIVIDVNGARTVEQHHPEVISLFLTAASKDILVERIKSRGTWTESDLEQRFKELEAEMTFAQEADHVIENKEGQLEDTIAKIQAIVEKETSKS